MSPNGRTIEVHFERGALPAGRHLKSCCKNVHEQWCPNSNLFADEEEARGWADEHETQARVMSLDEASDLGTSGCADLI